MEKFLHKYTEMLLAVKQHLGLDQEDSDLRLLALVADVLQTIQNWDAAQAHFTPAALPPLRHYGERVGFRGKLSPFWSSPLATLKARCGGFHSRDTLIRTPSETIPGLAHQHRQRNVGAFRIFSIAQGSILFYAMTSHPPEDRCWPARNPLNLRMMPAT